MEEASIDRLIDPVMRCVVADFRSLFRQVFESVDRCRFGAAERLLRGDGIGILRKSMEEMLLSSMEERSLPEDRPCPNCSGGRLKSTGFRPKLLDTSLGLPVIRRRRYGCDSDACRTTVYPRDLELDLQRGRASPEMRRLAGLLGKEASFATASSLFENLLGVRCNAKKMQRLATRLGAAMEADRQRREPVPPAHDSEAVIHGSSDGTGVPVPNPKRPAVAVARKTAWPRPGRRKS